MQSYLVISIRFLLAITLVCGGFYPAFITMVSQGIWPNRANGSPLGDRDNTRGSLLIGQPFSSAQYLISRPSATAPTNYNGMASSGSNLGPTNPILRSDITSRIRAIQEANATSEAVPIDLVTTSASGLDPEISVAGALYQASRIAGARKLSLEQVRKTILGVASPRLFGALGEPTVNVLQANIALDRVSLQRLNKAGERH